jgi:hypothetical protein
MTIDSITKHSYNDHDFTVRTTEMERGFEMAINVRGLAAQKGDRYYPSHELAVSAGILLARGLINAAG